MISLSDSVNLAILQKIDSDLNITKSLDPEVKKRWYPLGIKTNYEEVMEPAHEFIKSMGRKKYIKPIF